MLTLFLTHLSFCLPEVVLIFLISTVLFVESTYEETEKKRYFLDVLVGTTLAIVMILLFLSFNLEKILFSKTYLLNSKTQFFKIFFISSFFGIFFFERKKALGESLTLSLILLLGSFNVTSSQNWALTYLGIEIMSFMAYALVALKKNAGALKAALKYFFFGSLASALFLLSLAHIYGSTHTLMYSVVGVDQSFFIHLIYLALFMKFSLIPFHFWSLEVYLESESFTQYLLQLIPKGALIALFYEIQKILPLNKNFFLIFLSFQFFLGPYVFAREASLRRLLAGYSFLSTAFILSLFMLEDYLKPVLFSLYALIPLYLILFSETTSKIQSFIFFFAILSLIGIPPFAGFFVKWVFIKNLFLKQEFLVIVGILFQAIGLIYIFYPRFKKILFTDQKWSLGIHEIKLIFSLFILMMFGFFAPL